MESQLLASLVAEWLLGYTMPSYMGGVLALIAHNNPAWILGNLLPDNHNPKYDDKAVVAVNVNYASADGLHPAKISCQMEEFNRLLSRDFL